MNRNQSRLVLVVLMLLALGNAALLFVHRLVTNGDNLDYLFIAGRVLNGDMLAPFHWRFPVGYPYFLSAFCHVAGISIGTDPLSISPAGIMAIKVIGLSLFPLSVIAIWRWSRDVLSAGVLAAVITGLFATSQQVAPLFSIIGSEPCFILCSWIALWAWESVLDGRTRSNRRLILAVVFTVLAFLFRQIALAIPVAVFGAALLQQPWSAWRQRVAPAMGSILLVAACIGLMLASNASHLKQLSGSEAEASASAFMEKVELLGQNLQVYQAVVPGLILPKIFGADGLLALAGLGFVSPVVVVLIYLLLAVGFILCLARRGPGLVSALYVAVSVAIILVWPYRDGRFFLPLLPALWMFIVSALRLVHDQIFSAPEKGVQRLTLLLLLLVGWQCATNLYAGRKNLAASAAMHGLPAWHPQRYEATGETDFADHVSCGLWIREHTSPGAMVYAEKPYFMALSSGRKTRFIMHFIEGPARQPGSVEEAYVVVDSFPATAGYGRTKLRFLELLESDPASYEEVYRAGHGARVFRQLVPELHPGQVRNSP